jgi:hypothetical protein
MRAWISGRELIPLLLERIGNLRRRMRRASMMKIRGSIAFVGNFMTIGLWLDVTSAFHSIRDIHAYNHLVATSGIIHLVLVCKILNVIYWSISIVTLVAKVRASKQWESELTVAFSGSIPLHHMADTMCEWPATSISRFRRSLLASCTATSLQILLQRMRCAGHGTKDRTIRNSQSKNDI